MKPYRIAFLALGVLCIAAAYAHPGLNLLLLAAGGAFLGLYDTFV